MPFDIFGNLDSAMTEKTEQTFIQKLWDRKIPQYLGSYLAVGFGLLQFLEFVTDRYDMSSFWVDKYLLVWLIMIPAIITLIYFNGQLTDQGSLKWPKFIVVGNTIVALLLGGFLFNGDTTIKASEVVELTNEEGQTVTAVVPSLNKVKNVAVFQFENLTSDEDQDWWGVAFSELLDLNLEQRSEFYTFSQFNLNSYYDQLGLPSFELPSVGMQREIAQKSRNDYFTRISYDVEGDQYVFKGDLYSSRDSKSIFKIDAVANDPFEGIDLINQQIAENIPDALDDLEDQVRLPSSSLITNNQEALKYFIQSRLTFYKDPTALDEVVRLAKKAVELDPTCSLCHFYVGDPLYGLGKRDEAITYIRKAIRYGSSLPERMQFGPKAVLYSITNKMDAYLKLQKVRRQIFPYDFGAYSQLLPIYQANYGIDSAKMLMQEAIDNGNIERGLLSLYDLQLENEEYAAAEATLDRFSQEFPDRDQDRMKYATIYENQGKLEKAREILLKEEMLDPINTTIQNRLAYIDFKDGAIDQANQRVEQGLEESTTLSDSLNFLWIKAYFYHVTGQIQNAEVAYDVFEKHGVKRTPINRMVTSTLYPKADMYYSIGRPDKVQEALDRVIKYAPQSSNLYACMVDMIALGKDYNISMSTEEFHNCTQTYASYGDGYAEYVQTLVSYLDKDYDNCIKILDNDDGRIEKLFGDMYLLANIYAKAGKVDNAIKIIKKALDEKTDEPIYYYQMATFLENDDKEKAKEHLDIALKYWSKADTDFIPLQRAIELQKRLTNSSL